MAAASRSIAILLLSMVTTIVLPETMVGASGALPAAAAQTATPPSTGMVTPPAEADAKARAAAAYDAKNYKDAMKLYLPLAQKGDSDAQYHIGRMYEKGQGVWRNYDEMAKWYIKAAEGGHPAAQYRVAVGYYYGFAGLPKDEEQALKWLRRAAEGGDRKAQKILGRAYEEGRLGLPVDPKQAEYWKKKSESKS